MNSIFLAKYTSIALKTYPILRSYYKIKFFNCFQLHILPKKLILNLYFYTQNKWLSLKLYKNEIVWTMLKKIFLFNLSNSYNITTNKSIICIYKLLNQLKSGISFKNIG